MTVLHLLTYWSYRVFWSSTQEGKKKRNKRKRNRDKDPQRDSNAAPHPTSSPGNRQLHPATTGSKARPAGATRPHPAAGQVAGAVRRTARRLQQAQGIAGQLFHSSAQPWRGRAAARIGPWGGRDDGPPTRVRLTASSRHRRVAWIRHRGRRLRDKDQPAATTLSQNGANGGPPAHAYIPHPPRPLAPGRRRGVDGPRCVPEAGLLRSREMWRGRYQ